MTYRAVLSLPLILTLAATPVWAGNHTFKNTGAGARSAAACPPGLAKKTPPCVPPGQAKKGTTPYLPGYRPGDRIYDDYVIIRDPRRYGLSTGALYYLVGREVFRISPETGRVLAFVGLADALLN